MGRISLENIFICIFEPTAIDKGPSWPLLELPQCFSCHTFGMAKTIFSVRLILLDAPNLVSFGRFCNCPLGGFHALCKGFDFDLALRLVSLFPFYTPLDITAQRATFWIGQYAGSIKSVTWWTFRILGRNFCLCCDWIFSSPFFPAIVKLNGQWLAGLGCRFGPTGVPAVLEAVPIGVCVRFAVGRAHDDGNWRFLVMMLQIMAGSWTLSVDHSSAFDVKWMGCFGCCCCMVHFLTTFIAFPIFFEFSKNENCKSRVWNLSPILLVRVSRLRMVVQITPPETALATVSHNLPLSFLHIRFTTDVSPRWKEWRRATKSHIITHPRRSNR